MTADSGLVPLADDDGVNRLAAVQRPERDRASRADGAEWALDSCTRLYGPILIGSVALGTVNKY
jgi:hypothetical protein